MTPRQALVDAFKNNPYQTAAFAKLSALPEADDWKELRRLLDSSRMWFNQEEFALILWLLLAAGEQYDDNRFWPVVARKLGRAAILPKEQDRLGGWFRDALERFDYAIPKGGRRNLQPILVHVGIPQSNYGPLLHFLQKLLNRWGPSIQMLDAEQIAALIPEKGSPDGLHVATLAFLKSQQTEVAELWTAILEVLRRRAEAGRWKDALAELPAFLPRDIIQRSLPPLEQTLTPTTGTNHVVPRFVYQADFGRVVVEGSPLDEMEVQHGNRTLALGPCEATTTLPTRALLEPLPPTVQLRWLAELGTQERDFYDKYCPVLWFRAGTGRYYGGAPEPGTWYLLLRGNIVRFPREMMVEAQSLNWWSLSGDPWQAFRVELVAGQPFKVTIDGNEYAQHLAKQTSQHPALTNIVLQGQLLGGVQHGDAVAILQDTPQLHNPKNHPIDVVLEGSDEQRHSLRIDAGKTETWPMLEPGVYRVRYRPTIGVRQYWQPLPTIAYVPGLQPGEPIYTDHREAMALTVATPATGELHSAAPFTCTRTTEQAIIQGLTVPPTLRLEWHWQQANKGPNVTWSVPLVGVRWRLQTNEGLGPWTREPFELDSRKTYVLEARLELQAPPDLVVRHGPMVWKPYSLGTCAEYRQDLKSLTGDVLTIHINERPHDLVYLSARPHLTHFDVDSLGKQLRITYKGHIPEAVKLLEWNLLTPWERPREHPRGSTEATIPDDDPTRPRLFALAAVRKGLTTRYDIAWDSHHTDYGLVWPKDAPSSLRNFWKLLLKLATQQHQGRKLSWDAILENPAEDSKGLDAEAVNTWIASLPESQAALKQDASHWWRRFGPKPPRNDLSAFHTAFMEVLGEGIHTFAEGEPSVSGFGTPENQELFAQTYPLRFFEALRALREPLAEYRQRLPDGSWLEWLREEARFVFCTIKKLNLGSLLDSLPLAERFSLANCHWNYRENVSVTYRSEPHSVSRMRELLGLKDIELHVPSCDKYANWHIQSTDKHHDGWTCLRSNPVHKRCPRIDVQRPPIADFFERLQLKHLLETFPVPNGIIGSISLPEELMRPNTILPFWRHYLEGMRQKPSLLLIGRLRQTVNIVGWNVPSAVQQLWELSWLERLYCTRTDKTGWEPYTAQLPQQLRVAFGQNPQATCRMLILVEWVRVLIEHGGIGFAARYAF